MDGGSIACIVAALAPQSEIWREAGSSRQERLGAAMGMLSDLDGDRIDDLAVVSIGARPGHPDDDDRLILFSGIDLSPIREFSLGPIDDAVPNRTLADVGDVDGDGLDDLAVGLPGHGSFGSVRVISSADGHELLVLEGDAATGGRFGAAVFALDDVDGDGVRELLIGAPGFDSSGFPPPSDETRDGGPDRGFVHVRSGRDGTLRAEWSGTIGGGGFGAEAHVCRLGDLDGDGFSEFALGDVVSLDPTVPDVLVTIISGRTLAPLTAHRLVADPTSYLLAAAGDADGDGHDDFALGRIGGYHGSGTSPGPLEIRGSLDGRLLATRSAICLPSSQVVPVGDIDHDGHGDLAVTTFTVFENDSVSWCTTISGRDGHTIVNQRIGHDGLPPMIRLCGPARFDRDGWFDVATGGTSSFENVREGLVLTLSPRHGTELSRRYGIALDTSHRAVSVGADVDGDGIDDLVEVLSHRSGDSIVLLSGADGTTLREHQPDRGVRYDGPLLRLPDLDGDGIDDLALSRVADGRVEIRAGGTFAPLLLLSDARPGIEFGAALAVAIDETGRATALAVGAPLANDGSRIGSGEVSVFDLPGGALRWAVRGAAAIEQLGRSLSSIGDIDGDGEPDWAAGAPRSSALATQAGRVSIRSGRDGAQLANLRSDVTRSDFGRAIATVPDLGGDGIDDLMIGAPGGVGADGFVRIVDGGTWATRFTITPPAPKLGIGRRVAVLPDANGDGVPELAAATNSTVVVSSGADGSFLHEQHGADPIGFALGAEIAVAPPWSWRPLAKGALPSLFATDTTPPTALVRLDYHDLFLAIDPDHARKDDLVTATLRGGSPGADCGLYLDELDDFPLQEFLGFGVLDSQGSWSIGAVVPPGLAGTSYRLRAYAAGFDGRLAESSDETLWFQ